jgi:hypothetical protein
MGGAERIRFEALKGSLRTAFAEPDETYETLTANDIIARNRPT